MKKKNKLIKKSSKVQYLKPTRVVPGNCIRIIEAEISK